MTAWTERKTWIMEPVAGRWFLTLVDEAILIVEWDK